MQRYSKPSEVYLKPSGTSKMDLFYENSKRPFDVQLVLAEQLLLVKTCTRLTKKLQLLTMIKFHLQCEF